MVAGATAVPMMLLALGGLPTWPADRDVPVAARPLVVRGEQRSRVHGSVHSPAPERPAAVPVTLPVALPARTSRPPVRGRPGARRTVSRHHAAARHAPSTQAPATPAPAPTPAATAPPAPAPAPVPTPVPVPAPALVETPQVADKHARKDDEDVELHDTTPALESEPAKKHGDDGDAPEKQKAPKVHKDKSLRAASDEQPTAPAEDAPEPGEAVVASPPSTPSTPADQGAAPEGKGPKGEGPKGKRSKDQAPEDDGPAAPGSRPARKGNQGPGRKKG